MPCTTDQQPSRRVVVEVIDEQMVEILRQKTIAEKIAMVGAAHRTARNLIRCGVKMQHPEWTEQDVHDEVLRRLLNGTT